MRNNTGSRALDADRARVREELGEIAGCATVTGKILAGGAIKTVVAAAGAALAFEILSSRQENTVGFTRANTAASQAIGAAILSVLTVPLLWGFSLCYPSKPHQNNTCTLTTFLLSSIFVVGAINTTAGVFENLIGAAILDLVVASPSGRGTPQSDFSASAGALAGVMPPLVILVPALVLRVGYLLAYDNCLAPYAQKEVQEQPKAAKPKGSLFAFKSSNERPYLLEEDVDPTFHPTNSSRHVSKI